MLQSFHIQNFKCLRDTTLELGPFTVLIGPNDSGKTSILDALRLLGQTFTHPFTDVFVIPNQFDALVWGREVGLEIIWQALFAEGEERFAYDFCFPSGTEEGRSSRGSSFRRSSTTEKTRFEASSEIRSASTFPQPTPHETILRALLAGRPSPLRAEFAALLPPGISELSRYRLDPDALRTPAVPQPDAVLSSSGDNLVAVLDRLISGPDRTAIVELERNLHAAIPTLRGISLRTAEAGKKSLEFVLAGPGKPLTTIPCAHASDGAMLLTAYLALAYSEQPGMLLIEEPENGLHPSRLQSVVEMLRKLSTGEVGPRPRQVILTTHSPLLLNYAKPEEVRIVRRDPESGTNITALTAVPDISKLLEEFGVGELWNLLGEDALVTGKKP
jgi:predicted ATPase